MIYQSSNTLFRAKKPQHLFFIRHPLHRWRLRWSKLRWWKGQRDRGLHRRSSPGQVPERPQTGREGARAARACGECACHGRAGGRRGPLFRGVLETRTHRILVAFPWTRASDRSWLFCWFFLGCFNPVGESCWKNQKSKGAGRAAPETR